MSSISKSPDELGGLGGGVRGCRVNSCLPCAAAGCVCRHGLRVENMPCFIPNDRSKRRLIQDTEDWQPRTGTTQSRSFRILAQLTGTDFSKAGRGHWSETVESDWLGGGAPLDSLNGRGRSPVKEYLI